jgi:hypothetical protein
VPVRRVDKQPQELVGFEYHNGEYEWSEFYSDKGVYAVCGVTLNHPTEMWMYWRILAPSISAWRDLKRNVVPHWQQYARDNGKKFVVVQTDDPNDTHFTKMVELMEFKNHRVRRTSWQEV